MHFVIRHLVAQSAIHQLVALNQTQAFKFRRHNGAEPMPAIAFDMYVFTRHTGGNHVFNLFSIHTSPPDFVTCAQQMQRDASHDQIGTTDQPQTGPGRDIADTEKAVAKTVDHVEERIEMADLLPERRQRMYGIKHAAQKRHGRDEEILE